MSFSLKKFFTKTFAPKTAPRPPKTDKQTDRQTDGHTHTHTHTHTQTDTQTEETDRQTNRQTDRHPDTQTHRHTDTQTVYCLLLNWPPPGGRVHVGHALNRASTTHRPDPRSGRLTGDGGPVNHLAVPGLCEYQPT